MPLPQIIDRFDPSVAGERLSVAAALSEGLTYRSDTLRRYEQALAQMFDARAALAVSSGFGALVVALSALGLKPGDKVLLTPTCPLCTAYALTFMRLEPVFCDISPDDFSIDLASAQRRFDGKTRAVLDIPMWGYPIPARKTAEFARQNGVPYVLDIALAHMATLDGQPLWTYAHAGTFSTHVSKNFVTGEGGAVLTNDIGLADRARRFVYPDDIDVAEPSLNYALAGLQAALGLARLERLKPDIDMRRAKMQAISDALTNPHLEPLPLCAGGQASGTKLIIRETSGHNGALMQHLTAAGVPSDIATYRCKPLYQYPVFGAYEEACPNAERMLASITTIPVHPDVDANEIARICDALNSYRPGLN